MDDELLPDQIIYSMLASFILQLIERITDELPDDLEFISAVAIDTKIRTKIEKIADLIWEEYKDKI